MAEAVVSIVLETLRDLLVEEAKFLSGVSSQVKELQAELTRMMSFLKDVDHRKHESEGVQNWVREVRGLAYRAQDVLEKYAIEVSSKRGSGIMKLLQRFCCVLREGVSVHEAGKEIIKIKTQISDLTRGLETYGINRTSEEERVRAAEEKQRMLRMTYAHEDDEDFVGMEDEINKLVTLMTNDDEKAHRVISIYGMGGSGKTTLARKVYKHPQLQRAFDSFSWVCISQKCEAITVFQDLLKQLTGEETNNSAEAVRKIYQVLREKKCLVILDDIWNIDDWTIFSHAFPKREGKSKILLTTRIAQVAKEGFVHEQRQLTEEEGLELLRKKAISDEYGQTDVKIKESFEDLGRRIVHKCGRLPLAISALGGVLRNKNSIEEWEMIINDDGSNRIKGIVGELDGIEMKLAKVLGLSYDDLPHYLKPCFLYMGIFREDEEIGERRLYHLWIAEGMVSVEKQMKNEATLMDVAQRYMDELVSRGMVQRLKDPEDGISVTYRLHDLMRDLCLMKAKEDEFLECMDDLDFGKIKNPYRCAVHFGPGQEDRVFKFAYEKASRALFFRCKYHPSIWEIRGEALSFEKLRSLRAIEFDNCWLHDKKLLSGITKQVHLTYLSLRDSRVKELPMFVGNLPLLQTLDLRTRRLIRLPHNIFSNMKNLRHLYLDYFYLKPQFGRSSKKLRLNGLCQLETLTLGNSYSSREVELTDLSKLVNIQYFQIDWDWLSGDDVSWIAELTESWKKVIRFSKVSIHHQFPMIEYEILGKEDIKKVFLSRNVTHLILEELGYLSKLPNYEPQFCQTLSSLRLIGTIIEEDGMDFLKKLPKLVDLHLSEAFEGKEINCHPPAFTRLRSLSLVLLNNLEKLSVIEGSLPNLTTLSVLICSSFGMVSEASFGCLHNLKHVTINYEKLNLSLPNN